MGRDTQIEEVCRLNDGPGLVKMLFWLSSAGCCSSTNWTIPASHEEAVAAEVIKNSILSEYAGCTPGSRGDFGYQQLPANVARWPCASCTKAYAYTTDFESLLQASTIGLLHDAPTLYIRTAQAILAYFMMHRPSIFGWHRQLSAMRTVFSSWRNMLLAATSAI